MQVVNEVFWLEKLDELAQDKKSDNGIDLGWRYRLSLRRWLTSQKP